MNADRAGDITATRVRLRAALAVLEDLILTLDEHPDWVASRLTDQHRLAAKLSGIKHQAQRELIRAWKVGELGAEPPRSPFTGYRSTIK